MKVVPPTIFLFVTLLGVSFAKGQTTPPNIVIILADDLGYGDVGFNGCPDIPTPNIDSIAANGVLCTNGYVTHPFCSPSRAALMTGRYQQRFGYENGLSIDKNNPRLGLPATELSLAEVLKPAGYACGAIGKWHLGNSPALYPTARGFDEFFGFLVAASSYYNARVLSYGTWVTEPDYLTDAFTREAVAFVNNHASQPFFLYLAYNAVHSPYQTPPQVYMDRVASISDPGRQKYAAMAVAMDDGVGQVLQTLQANNILANTLIFFLSDNGAPDDNSFTLSSNYPLRGYKLDLLEGGIRVPFAVQWTGALPAQTIYNDLVSSLDIFSTVLAAAGVPLPNDRVYDGVNMLPYWTTGQSYSPRALFWRWFGLGPQGPPGSVDSIWAVRSGPLKLVVERAKAEQPPALYNLPNDSGEYQDLAATQPDDVNYLSNLYSQWSLETVAPLWQGDSNFASAPLVLAGDWNGFNKSNDSPPWLVGETSAPGAFSTPDGFNWFTTTIHVATGGDTTAGQHSFVLIGGQTYAKQWGGVNINIDDVTTLPYFSGNALGPVNLISFEDGFYYSFRVLDPLLPPPLNLNLAVMKTSAPPVTVSWSGQTPARPTSSDPVTVSITLNQAKSPEERIYLRWTTNMFLTSNLIEATGSDVSYSATIPPQASGSLLQYSIITSTTDLTPYCTAGAIDPRILATTGSFNAYPSDGPAPTPTPFPVPTPTPSPSPPVITVQPLNITVTEGKTARFEVKAAGVPLLQYQWMKNGVNISGATQGIYLTPAETLADNGALFSVTVSNPGGNVTSNNAALTVNPSLNPPVITRQPVSKTVDIGQVARFFVTATGTGPLRYQWTKNGSNIIGATKKAYVTPPATAEDNGAIFAVVVRNVAGSAVSNNAVLTVQ